MVKLTSVEQELKDLLSDLQKVSLNYITIPDRDIKKIWSKRELVNFLNLAKDKQKKRITLVFYYKILPLTITASQRFEDEYIEIKNAVDGSIFTGNWNWQ